MSFNFFEYPFPFPCGEAIRRHVARGVDYATLKTTPSHEAWVVTSASRLNPSGTLCVTLTPTPLRKVIKCFKK
jgi:tRNA1(Val) A37 N6-methylase TrmN6